MEPSAPHPLACVRSSHVELDERRLVAGLIAGDEPCWRLFNARFGPALLDEIARVARRFPALMSGEDVRDVHAELCLQLLEGDKRRLRQYDPLHGTPLRAWLGVVARHAAHDFLRRRRRQQLVPWRGEGLRLEQSASAAPDPLCVCAAREQARLVAELFEDLSARDRQFVRLHFYEGLDPEQTAQQLGICVGTVYSKKHKIRARIESLLVRRRAA